MKSLIKKHTGSLMWAFLPSLLLVVSVFGVHFISRPVVGGGGGCSIAADCNSADPNPCRQFDCLDSVCEPIGIDRSVPGCGVCADTNCATPDGVCDDTEQNCNSLGQDCAGLLVQGCDLGICSGNSQDFCCDRAIGCQGTTPTATSFDIDCGCCGDSAVGTGEQCDLPVGSTCTANGTAGFCDAQCQCTPPGAQCGDGTVTPPEQCDPALAGSCTGGQTCNPTTCQCEGGAVCGDGTVDAGEECDGPTCNFVAPDGAVIPGVCELCVCIPECQTEGSGCGDDGSDLPAVCFSGTGGGGGSSLIPMGVRAGALAQWLAALTLPGLAFMGLKFRKRIKK